MWACFPDNSQGIPVYLLKSSQEFPAALDKNKGFRNGRYGFTPRMIARRTCTLGCSFQYLGSICASFQRPSYDRGGPLVRLLARVSSVYSVPCSLCMVPVTSESLENISINIQVHRNPCYELLNGSRGALSIFMVKQSRSTFRDCQVRSCELPLILRSLAEMQLYRFYPSRKIRN